MVRRDEASVNEQETTRRSAEPGSHSVKSRRFSGEGETVKNLIMLIGGMITIVASFWLFASYPNSFWLFLLGILAYGLALFVPTALISGSTAKHSAGGTDVTLDLPRGPHEMAQRPNVPNQAQVNH
ncbi:MULTISPECIES: hypothetical protein [Kocuria]|uniref:Uncharacterized protein n=1 Tax=Kocuria gwangalliensis TaxID=501592 RepID=A0ABP8WXP7_9MICC|nr:hypothetical protein [Kocuria sp.]MDO5368100.1 hypothetical protein [Kocuria sp.]